MMPLSTPLMAIVGMFTGFAYWNDWINGLYYINDPKLYGVQQLFIRILDNINFLNSGAASSMIGNVVVDLSGASVCMVLAVIGILPILLFSPYSKILYQRYCGWRSQRLNGFSMKRSRSDVCSGN
jgi:putative aldouronate transport system permease protein